MSSRQRKCSTAVTGEGGGGGSVSSAIASLNLYCHTNQTEIKGFTVERFLAYNEIQAICRLEIVSVTSRDILQQKGTYIIFLWICIPTSKVQELLHLLSFHRIIIIYVCHQNFIYINRMGFEYTKETLSV